MLAPTMQVQLYFFIPMQLRVLMAGVTIVSVSCGEVCVVLNVASVGAVRPSLSPQLWYELRGTLGRLGIWSCGGVDAAEVYGVHAEMVNHVGSTLLSGQPVLSIRAWSQETVALLRRPSQQYRQICITVGTRLEVEVSQACRPDGDVHQSARGVRFEAAPESLMRNHQPDRS